MKSASSRVIAAAMLFLATAIVAAQAPDRGQGAGQAAGQGAGRGAAPQQAPPTNLQILPKDMTFQQVAAVMQNFTAALGVNCGYCHVFVGPNNPMNDFASDMKPQKNMGRVMMRAVREVNAKFGAELGKPAAEVTQVGCVTCHRGVAIPKQLVDIVAQTANDKGAATAGQQYRELRKQYYGGQAYDFSENSLITAAQRSVAAKKPDDAIALLQVNIEFNPNSARSYQGLAQAYQAKGDKENQIKSLEKAVELDPKNPQFQNQLKQAKGGA